MRNFIQTPATLAIAFLVAGVVGCHRENAPLGASNAEEQEHDHSHEGVHGGQVIELGDENYHAELIHDDSTHQIGVYLLDQTAQAAAPVAVTSVTINTVVADKPLQFALPAVPQPGDPAGKASYFELISEDLCDRLDAGGGRARLGITIDGRPYVGEIETHGHGHAHDEK